MRTTGRNLLGITVLLFLFGLAVTSAFGDSLTVTGAPSGSVCSQTVSFGSALVLCANPGVGDTATASGDLANGIFGASTIVDIGAPIGSSSSADVGASWNFAVAGVQTGTAAFNVTLLGTLTGAVVGCTQPIPADCAMEVAQLYYRGQESISIGGVPGPSGFVDLGGGFIDATVYTNIANASTQLNLELFVGANCGGFTGSCTSSTDFIDPVSITGVSIYDSNGDLVPGASMVSDGGFNPNGAAVPEPSTLMLIGSGLLGLVGKARRKGTSIGKLATRLQ